MRRSGTTGAPTRRGLLDGNRIGRRKGVLEGFVERLFQVPALIAIAIVLIRFAFRIGNHFGFSDGADEDLRGYDANFGALLVERYPFRVVRLPQNVLMATRPSAVFFSHLMRWQRRWSFHQGDAVPHRLLHLLEGTHAYLAHALARDAELVGELLERDRFFGEPARLEDAPLPVVEHGERRGEGLAAAATLLAASVVSWSRCSSTNQSCHSLELLSSRIGASSDTSPPRRRFMSTTSCSVTPRRLAMS